MRETSYRTRPLVFYTFAAIAAATTGANTVAIGENGQGGFGPALLPFADEWPFRSAHPAFVERWAHFLRLCLGKTLEFEQPQLWRTKGEVLSILRHKGLVERWEETRSCASRPPQRYGSHGCGICGGCVLRTVAAHAAGLTEQKGAGAVTLFSPEGMVRQRNGVKRPVTPGERAVAVRAICLMAELARLADSLDSASAIDLEARLVDPANPGIVRTKLCRLLRSHRDEWDAFIDALPSRSWVRGIVDRL